MTANQYVCRKCHAIVVVPNAKVLTPEERQAIAESLCRQCLGPREVKGL